MKKFIILMVLASSVFMASCSYSWDSNNQIAKQQEELMQEVNRQVGMPGIVNFQEKKLAKMIFELRDRADLVTYTYITAKNTGELKFLCNSIGYGLPYSVQYTNPEARAVSSGGGYYLDFTLPQADPNGLFMPDGLSATWVMCVDSASGDTKPVYVENEIIVSPIKLK